MFVFVYILGGVWKKFSRVYIGKIDLLANVLGNVNVFDYVLTHEGKQMIKRNYQETSNIKIPPFGCVCVCFRNLFVVLGLLARMPKTAYFECDIREMMVLKMVLATFGFVLTIE